MKIRHFAKALVAGSLMVGVFTVTPAAHAHVSVYVAGMSGVAIDTTTTNATYLVSFAPGHGCSGPRTAANPDGVYETTSLEVSMPRNSAGSFIFPEVRVVHGGGYRATIKSVPDPTNPALKRVGSIVFDNFRLPAVNGTMTARDAQLFTIAVKLPKLADIKTANTSLASGSNASLAAKIYFPTMQYCDVTDQGVGIQASTSTPAGVNDKVDPACTNSDSIQTTLYDDWTTVGNTPSLLIGTSTSNFLEITGNKPTVAAAAAHTFCSKAGGFNPRDLPLAGQFSAKVTGSTKKVLTVRVDGAIKHAGRTFSVYTPKGALVGKAKVDQNGIINVRFTGSKINKLKSGLNLRLKWKSQVLATDAS